MKVAWFSCGATSAVACKLGLQKYPDLEICYIETGSHHPDNMRFLHDCEKWFGKKITILRSAYKDIFDVFERTGFIHSAHYAPCTQKLKTLVRQQYEYEHDIDIYIYGVLKRVLKRKIERKGCASDTPNTSTNFRLLKIT